MRAVIRHWLRGAMLAVAAAGLVLALAPMPAGAEDAAPAAQETAPASAVSDQDWNDCSSDDSTLSIRVCTGIIDRGDKVTTNDRAMAHMKRAVSHYRKGQVDAAIEDWTASLVFQPNSALVLKVRAGVLIEQAKYAQAVADYSRVLALDPKDITTLLLRCTTRVMDFDLDGAIGDAYQAIGLDATRSEPRYVIGHVAFLRHDFDRAAESLDEAISLLGANPTSHGEYFSMRGLVRLYLGDLDEAQADFAKAAEIAPKLALAYTGQSQIARLRGKTDDALAALGKGIALLPESASLYADRANILIEAGRGGEAGPDLDKAIDLASEVLARPVLQKAERSDALSNRAYARVLQGDYAQALADANEAIGLDPRNGEVKDTRGLAYANSGDYARAISDLSESLASSGDVLSITLHRAQTHQAFGNYALAIEDYRKILSWAPDFPAARIGLAGSEAAAKVGSSASGTPAADNADSAGGAESASTDAQAATTDAQSATTPAATTGKRVALVIGNGAYAKFGVLKNPKHDAETVANALEAVGFTKVLLGEDLGAQDFNEALRQFAAEADGADWAVIYYAGHGLEVDKTNYLVPIDAKLAADRDVPFETMPLDRLITAVGGAKVMRLIVLDACRDNPFAATMTKTAATRSIGRGLGDAEPDAGTLIAYAARAGQVAQDGDGDNSPFAAALATRIRAPGLELGKLFRLVRSDVMSETGRKQEPWIYGSLSGDDLYFNPPAQ